MPRPLKQKPLFHHVQGHFSLDCENDTQNSTILQVLKCNADLDPIGTPVYTNPANSNFTGEVNHISCYPNSSVYKYYVELMVNLDDAIGTNVHALMYRWMNIMTSFDDIAVEENQTGETIGSVLQLQKKASTESNIHPIWSATSLDDASNHENALDADGIASPYTHKSVAFDREKFHQYLRSRTVGNKLKSITDGGLKKSIIYKDRPYIQPGQWFETPGKVERMNEGTFMGMLIDVPMLSESEQFYNAAGVNATTALNISYNIWFNEYNDEFISI